MRTKVISILIAATLLVTGCSDHSQHVPTKKTPSTAQSHSSGIRVSSMNGTGTSSSSGSTASATAQRNQSVNGCDPTHSVYGPFCVSTVPVWTQSSAGLTEWSHIEVGATVEIKGATAVSAKTGRPKYEDVEIIGPGSFQRTLPVVSSGGFDKKITFPKAGTYRIGVGNEIQKEQGLSFHVYYVPHPKVSATLTNVFPNSQRKLPDDVVLVFPYATKPTVRVRFTNAGGNPASGVKLQGTRNGTVITTNSKGVAKVSLSAKEPFLGIHRIYGSLFALPYLTGSVSNGVVTAWPREMQKKELKSPPQIVRGGVTYYETSAALALLDPVAFSGDELGQSYSKTGDLILRPRSVGHEVTVTRPGVVKGSRFTAHVVPIIHDGKLYLDVPDLVKVLNTFAWASLSPNGTLRVADFLSP